LDLAAEALNTGFRLSHHAELGSTNDEAAARARAGDPGRLWIVADQQTGGRGRHGRQWVSPQGNLYASLLLIDPAPLHRAPELGFVAGVSVARALRDLLGGDRRLQIKWPNDILYSSAKLAGILLESVSLPNGQFACIIGIGVNCRSHPDGLGRAVTDLTEIGSPLASPQEVLRRVSNEFISWLGLWTETNAFDPIRTEWLALAAGLGTMIQVTNPPRKLEGLFRTIDAAGRLILATDHGEVSVEAGDVFLSPGPATGLAAL
jgi:BirA family biotin operon repressor/biotin-[acetyl-CoA-carboxylase] ligase